MKRAMIVGYDLYHDSTLRGKTVGACVSTVDQDYTKFYSQTQPHDNPTELGTNLAIFIRSKSYSCQSLEEENIYLFIYLFIYYMT